MSVKVIDGILFEQMIRCSLQNLRCFEQEINDINVFPVSDGDTGTNMRVTLENGINAASSTEDVGIYLKNLSKGMLFGARGNSGVILSQIFKGIFVSLECKGTISIEEFGKALVNGADFGYKSVVKPVEGTILTVTREGIRNTLNKISSDTDLLDFLKMYLVNLQIELDKTPERLPVLKKNGVVDSGSVGFIKIIEGMKKHLSNEVISYQQSKTIVEQIAVSPAPVNTQNNFTKHSSFTLGYCMEFIIQLMECKCDTEKVNLESIIETLQGMGESLVAVQEEDVIKIHIHVKNPVPVISYMLQYGEFISFKLENMQLQHNNIYSKEKKDLCIISVSNCAEITSLFSKVGCNYVIDDERLQQTTASDFINAVNQFDAEQYVILPNCKNLIPVANQAKQILEQKNITVVPTTDIAQGYYAMAMDDCDSSNIDFRVKQIMEGAEFIETVLVTTAVKSSSMNNLVIKNGEKVYIHKGDIIHNSNDICTGLEEALNKLDLSDRSSLLIFVNDNVSNEISARISEMLNANFAEFQQTVIKNSNSLYDIIIGVL